MEEWNFQFYILHIEKFLNLVLWGSHFHICIAVQHVDIRYSHGSNLNNTAKMAGFFNFDLQNLIGSSFCEILKTHKWRCLKTSKQIFRLGTMFKHTLAIFESKSILKLWKHCLAPFPNIVFWCTSMSNLKNSNKCEGNKSYMCLHTP